MQRAKQNKISWFLCSMNLLVLILSCWLIKLFSCRFQEVFNDFELELPAISMSYLQFTESSFYYPSFVILFILVVLKELFMKKAEVKLISNVVMLVIFMLLFPISFVIVMMMPLATLMQSL